MSLETSNPSEFALDLTLREKYYIACSYRKIVFHFFFYEK